MIILSINESLFYVPHNTTGVISICNNMDGNKLSCVTNNYSNTTSLNIGDSILIKLISTDSPELMQKFIFPTFISEETVEDDEGVYGFEVCVDNQNICMPFFDGGAATFVVTVNKGLVYMDAGSITSNKLLLDYYHYEMSVGDEMSVTIKKLDFISPPIREKYHSC